MGILFLIFVLILLVLVIVGLVKSGRLMGWERITAFSILFLCSVVFLFFSASAASRRLRFQKQFSDAADRNETLNAQVDRLKFGDPNDLAGDEESILYTLAELKKVTVDRGRVWRHSDLQSIETGSYTIQTMANGDAPPKDLPESIVVYGFAESENDAGQLLPSAYLGEFQVTSSNGGSVVLTPTNPLLDEQVAAIQNGQATKWTIYELMPLDSHQAFAAPGSEPAPDQLFGRMDEETVSRLLGIDPSLMNDAVEAAPDSLTLDPQTQRGALLKSYLKDGLVDENPPPTASWFRLEFTQTYTTDVDSDEERSALDGGYFDLSGRTVDPRLKRGGEEADIEFKAGDEIVLAELAAQELIDQNVARLVRRYYVRPLNDYQAALSDNAQRLIETRQSIALIQRETNIASATNELILAQIGDRQEERVKLDADLAQYEKEQAVITAESQQLEQRLADLRMRVKQTFAEVNAAHANLVSRGR